MTGTMGAAQSEWSTGEIIPEVSSFCSSISTFSFRANGMDLAL